MGIFDFFRRKRSWADLDKFAGQETSSGVRLTEAKIIGIPAVYACVRVLAESIASLPIIVYERTADGKDRARDFSMYGLLHDQPNPLMTSFELRQLMVGHLCLRGNAYFFIERDAGEVTALWPLHPDRVTVEVKGRDLLYVYQSDDVENRIVNYPQYNMIRFSEYKNENQLEKDSPVDFSTETDDAFLRGGYELNQTNIFCDRFFNQMPFKQIAEKYDITIGGALATYCTARDTLLKVVRKMDARKLGMQGARRSNLSDPERWFIMVEGLGLTKTEVARIEGKSTTTIGTHVRKMTAKYKDIFQTA